MLFLIWNSFLAELISLVWDLLSLWGMPPKNNVFRLVWRLRLEVWKAFSLPLLWRLKGTKAGLLILGQRWFNCCCHWFHCYFCCFCSCRDLWCNMLSSTRTTLRLCKRRWRTTAWQLSTSSWFSQRCIWLFYFIMILTKVVLIYSVLRFHESCKDYFSNLKLPPKRWQRKTQRKSSFLRWKKFTN